MLHSGILNPSINSLLARVRHNNALVISDRGFTNFPGVETVDISLVDDIPSVLQVFDAIKINFDICQVIMAEEFLLENSTRTKEKYQNAYGNIPVLFEPSDTMKKRVSGAIGIIRTADTIQYANMMVFSGRVEE